jgi:hypothetical protein
MLSYQPETITLHSQGEHELTDNVSSEMRKDFSSWPLNQFQAALEAELRKGIETTVATVIDEAGHTKSPLSTTLDRPDCGILLQRHRGRVAVSQCSETKSMVLGEMHYRSTSYLINPKPNITFEMDGRTTDGQLEVETGFSFVPSWWMTKFMTGRALKFDIVKLSTQGWQTNIHSFNVRNAPQLPCSFLILRRSSQKILQSLSSVGKATSKP